MFTEPHKQLDYLKQEFVKQGWSVCKKCGWVVEPKGKCLACKEIPTMTVKSIIIYRNIPDEMDVFLLEGDYSRFHEVYGNACNPKPGQSQEEHDKLFDELFQLYDDCWSKLPPEDPRVLVSNKDDRTKGPRTFMLNNFERVRVVHCGFFL